MANGYLKKLSKICAQFSCFQVETRDSFKRRFIGPREREDYEASRSSHRPLLLSNSPPSHNFNSYTGKNTIDGIIGRRRFTRSYFNMRGLSALFFSSREASARSLGSLSAASP